jgi:hypothetical protein
MRQLLLQTMPCQLQQPVCFCFCILAMKRQAQLELNGRAAAALLIDAAIELCQLHVVVCRRQLQLTQQPFKC